MTLRFNADDAFFTADTHFFHRAMMERRGFKTKEDMNNMLVDLWNEVVPHHATVFHLGDLTFGNAADTMSVLGQLNGRIILVKGNHDKQIKGYLAERFTSIHDLLEIDIEEAPSVIQRITLCHYAMRVWNRHHYGAWQLHGHSHGNLAPIGRSLDVGVDAQRYRPVSYGQVKSHISMRDIQVVDHHREGTR